MNCLTVRRTNNDPLDNTWEWLLLDSNYHPIAVSMRAYTTKAGAWRAVRRLQPSLKEGIGFVSEAAS